MTLLYRLARLVVPPLARLYFRLRVHGRAQVPRRGGLLIVANHSSHLDPLVLGCSAPRDLHFLARADLFTPGLFGWLIRNLQAIPLARGESDRRALERACSVLAAGGALVIFPEGTRSPDGRLGPFKPGVGLLALHAQVPVVVAHIAGTRRSLPRGARFPRPARVVIHWGQPRSADEWLRRAPAGLRGPRALAEALRREIALLGGQTGSCEHNGEPLPTTGANPQGITHHPPPGPDRPARDKRTDPLVAMRNGPLSPSEPGSTHRRYLP